MEYETLSLSIKSRDHFSFLVFFRVSTGDDHYGSSTSGVYREGDIPEFPFCCSFQESHQVRLYTGEYYFCFRIAHTDIVFYHIRILSDLDKPNEDNSSVSDFLFLESFNSRFYDAILYLLHEGGIGKRHRRDSSHTPCVQTSIPFAYTLVVLGGREYQVGISIGQDKTTELYPS